MPSRRCLLLVLLSLCKAFLFPPGALLAEAGGYTLHRIVIWAEPGDPNPRFQQDPATGNFTLLLPGSPPASGWDPVAARRFVVHGGAFVLADPLPLLRPRDPDPDWLSHQTIASLDLNRDGRAELLRARNVVVPDNRDPSAGASRVLVEIRENDRTVFGDLLEGPGEGPVQIHSAAAVDFTGEGYADLVVRLEGEGRSGIAFYSQSPLRYSGRPTRVIPGFSPSAFRCDRYGIFDLRRSPHDFFTHLPVAARPENPACQTEHLATASDGRGRCRYSFRSPYLGWIQELQVDFLPNDRILSFDLIFPSSRTTFRPEQALEFLTPVLGGGYTVDRRSEEGGQHSLWTWKGNNARAQLAGAESGGAERAMSLRLERN